MGVLTLLADARGAVLAREELLDQNWGTSAGSDENLSRVVSQCRHAFRKLGAPNPIRTVPLSGYAFDLPIQPMRAASRASYRPHPDAKALFLEASVPMARIAHPHDLALAVGKLEKAVAIDADFAVGWAMLAQARATAAAHTPFGQRLEQIGHAGDAARRALQIDRNACRPRTVLAQQMLAERDVAGAIAMARSAYEIGSDDAEAAMWCGYTLAVAGYSRRAVPLLEEAAALDPLQGRRHFVLAVARVASGDYEGAEQAATIAADLRFIGAGEASASAGYVGGDPQQAMARFEAALGNFQRIYEREPRFVSLLRFCSKGVFGASETHRRLLLGAAIPLSMLPGSLAEGLLPYVFLRTGTPRHFFASFGDRLLPGLSIMANYIWDASPSSRAIREAPGFTQFADRLGLSRAWRQHGVPDCLR